jgi:hypothetical protein
MVAIGIEIETQEIGAKREDDGEADQINVKCQEDNAERERAF